MTNTTIRDYAFNNFQKKMILDIKSLPKKKLHYITAQQSYKYKNLTLPEMKKLIKRAIRRYIQECNSNYQPGLENDGTGLFNEKKYVLIESTTNNMGGSYSVFAVDLDGDNKKDYVFGDNNHEKQIWFKNLGNFPLSNSNPDITSASCIAPCMGSVNLNLTGGDMPYQFLWSNGATTEDLDSLCAGWYFLSVTDANNLLLEDSFEIIEESINSGVIFSSNSTPLSNSNVYLIKHFVNNDSLVIIDSTFTDIDGKYGFNTQEQNCYIKAVPDSLLFPNDFPTYYLSSPVFQFADSLSCDTALNFSTIPGVNPGGAGFIGGTIGNGAGKNNDIGEVLAGVIVFLVDDIGQIYGFTATNSDGYFYFDNIPCGDYQIWVDDASTDNNLSPTISIIAPDCVQDSLQFILDNAKLSLQGTTGIRNITNSIGMEIFPNPAQNQFEVQLEGWNVIYSIEIFNVLGLRVYANGIDEQTSIISSADWSNGLYYITIKSNSGEILGTNKIVINR
jgi:hypothetical protein